MLLEFGNFLLDYIKIKPPDNCNLETFTKGAFNLFIIKNGLKKYLYCECSEEVTTSIRGFNEATGGISSSFSLY
jgi:hypothetical protein